MIELVQPSRLALSFDVLGAVVLISTISGIIAAVQVPFVVALAGKNNVVSSEYTRAKRMLLLAIANSFLL